MEAFGDSLVAIAGAGDFPAVGAGGFAAVGTILGLLVLGIVRLLMLW